MSNTPPKAGHISPGKPVVKDPSSKTVGHQPKSTARKDRQETPPSQISPQGPQLTGHSAKTESDNPNLPS